jgi:uncharacterized protein YecT (DUF1311 family)
MPNALGRRASDDEHRDRTSARRAAYRVPGRARPVVGLLVLALSLISPACSSRATTPASQAGSRVSFVIGAHSLAGLPIVPGTTYRRTLRYFARAGPHGSSSFRDGLCELKFEKISVAVTFYTATAETATAANCTFFHDGGGDRFALAHGERSPRRRALQVVAPPLPAGVQDGEDSGQALEHSPGIDCVVARKPRERGAWLEPCSAAGLGRVRERRTRRRARNHHRGPLGARFIALAGAAASAASVATATTSSMSATRRAVLPSSAALVCALIVLGCASAPAKQPPRLAPPAIHESFTRLPCPRSRSARRTTIGAEGCAEQRILRTDRLIDIRTNTIFRLLRDTTAKRRFLAAEKAWLAYRKASCTSVADVYRGGSAEPLAFATCVIERNLTHLRELASFERVLRMR